MIELSINVCHRDLPDMNELSPSGLNELSINVLNEISINIRPSDIHILNELSVNSLNELSINIRPRIVHDMDELSVDVYPCNIRESGDVTSKRGIHIMNVPNCLGT